MNKKIKKLTLSVETIRTLEEKDLEPVAGGATGPRICGTATNVCSGCSPCF